MPRIATAVVLLALLGCGGVDRAAPDAVAQAWVDAVGERDWDAVCELSVRPEGLDCPQVAEAGLGDLRGLALDGVFTSRDTGRVVVSADAGEPPGDLRLERRDGGWLVHFEVQVVR